MDRSSLRVVVLASLAVALCVPRPALSQTTVGTAAAPDAPTPQVIASNAPCVAETAAAVRNGFQFNNRRGIVRRPLIAVGAPRDATQAAAQHTDTAPGNMLRLVPCPLSYSLAYSRQDPAQPQAAPVRAAGGYMNIGFDGLFDAAWSSEPNLAALERGDHDPQVRGFTVPNAEISLDGAVDPYFKGFANIVYKIDANGNSGIELEEAYFLTSSLKWNLQLKGGQFFTEFGRQNPQHPHSWSFVDQPLVLNRMFGPDGLRSQGVRLSWLVPIKWYTEAMVSVLNSVGGTTFSFRSDESSEIHGGVPVSRDVQRPGDLLVVPRITASIDLSGTQTLLFGASAAAGPNNSGPDARTRISGADVYWKWKSAKASAGFPFVSWQTEGLSRRYDAATRPSAERPSTTLPYERLKDHGVYSQVLWGIKPRIVAGLRGDFVDGDQAAFDVELRGRRYRTSPNLTWYPTEFSKVRLQYNFDNRKGMGSDHSFFVQFEFILGAHAAHKF